MSTWPSSWHSVMCNHSSEMYECFSFLAIFDFISSEKMVKWSSDTTASHKRFIFFEIFSFKLS